MALSLASGYWEGKSYKLQIWPRNESWEILGEEVEVDRFIMSTKRNNANVDNKSWMNVNEHLLRKHDEM